MKFSGSKISAWLTVIRIQFYPMTWITFSLGAMIARSAGAEFNSEIYWIGYFLLFLIELLTILCNEYFDFGTDSQNNNASLFTGGTRVLVEGRLSFKEIRYAIFTVLAVILILGYIILRLPGMATTANFLLLSSALSLGVAYTVPPFKLCYRGLGELDVCITSSLLAILCGYSFQTGNVNNILPWVFSIPIFFSTFAAIVLAGVPDRLADITANKRTLTVIAGPKKAVRMAILFVLLAALSSFAITIMDLIKGMLAVILLCITVSHSIVLFVTLYRFNRSGSFDRRINNIMQLSLSYIIWFGLFPLLFYLL